MGHLGDSDLRELLGDIQILAKQAALPPDTAFSNEARDSLGRLFDRFMMRVYGYCRRHCLSRLPIDIPLDEFVETVFFRFVRSADKIRLQNEASTDDIERQLLSCFHRHAEWALRDAGKKKATTEELTDVVMRDIATQSTNVDLPSNPRVAANRAKLEAELNKLDSRASDVLVTSYQHQNLDTREFQLPEDVRVELCKRCNFSSANALAQYRLRRINELRSKLLSVA